jgi:uncharacterized membrane protein YheB (UPF0754 family)
MDLTEIKKTVRQYLSLKGEVELLSKRQSELKSRLTSVLESDGETDAKGHIRLTVEDELAGEVTLTKQRKVSKSLDMEVAESLLQNRGIKDKCIKMVPTLDEAAIMAAFYEGDLTEEDIDTMFPAKVSYAFLVTTK